MCGIVGGVGISSREATVALEHILRGDDGITVASYGEVVLGSRRHLVKRSRETPPARSDQPYTSADGRAHLVLNGELYNFREIRASLERGGARFETDGDTEVFLRLFERGGPGFVRDRAVDAMFAIAVLDEKAERLYVTRDWPGRVPLFYCYLPETRTFVFASELKGLRAISRLPLPQCRELRPGHILTLDLKTFELKDDVFYKPVVRKSTEPLLEVGEQLHRLLTRSARNRTMGDVPICTMLSGGIDSLMTTYYVLGNLDFSRLSYQPTSYVFAVEGHDSEDVRRARVAAEGFQAIGLTLREVYASAEQVVADIPEIVEIFEMRRMKALSVYPLPIYYYLAPVMRRDGFKVTIGGHGVDELLGAYDSWKELNKSHAVQTDVRSRLAFINSIYENMMRRASIIFMNRGPVEARFPFLATDVCEFMLGIDPRWLGLTPETADILLRLIDERAGPRNLWPAYVRETYDYLVEFQNAGGRRPDGADDHLAAEVDKLFWKLPLIVAGMHAAAESFLPVHLLFRPKLRGQHGSGLTALEPQIVNAYRDLGATDAEIFQALARQAYGPEPVLR